MLLLYNIEQTNFTSTINARLVSKTWLGTYNMTNKFYFTMSYANVGLDSVGINSSKGYFVI